MDEAVRTRALELVRRDLELAERMRSLDPSPGEVMRIEELRAMIEALSTGCRAGQHEFVVREGVPQLYCRRCGIGKVPEVQRPGVVDGDDAAQTIYRQAQKIEDLRHKVQSQERALSEQLAELEKSRKQVEALHGRIDSKVITSAISESERERYVQQIGQLVGERDRLKEQLEREEEDAAKLSVQVYDLKTQVQRLTAEGGWLQRELERVLEERKKIDWTVMDLKEQLRLAEDAAKSLRTEIESARRFGAFGRGVMVRDPDPELKRRIEDLEQNLGRMQVARDMASEQLASLRRSIRGFARQHAP